MVRSANFQHVNCFVLEQSMVFHKAAVQNIYNVLLFQNIANLSIFNAIKMQSGIGFVVDALLGNFAYVHNLYSAVELHTNFALLHFGSQLLFTF